MFIHEMFQQKPCVFSVEVFPPKKAGAAEETLYPVLRELCTLGPDYISVTYGAGGGTAGQSTAKIASYIKNGLHVEALAHLTCVNSTRVQVEETLTRLREDNVGKRSCPARGYQPGSAAPDGFPACERPCKSHCADRRLRRGRCVLS